MKEFFVKGRVSWIKSYVHNGEPRSKENEAEFDRFVSAESAKDAAKLVSERVIQKAKKCTFGTNHDVRIAEIAVYEKVEV